MSSLPTRLALGLLSTLFNTLIIAGITLWDLSLILYNLVAPARAVGKVTPVGYAGEGGKWPEWREPGEGDSRCSCPALNAMANHGILPRNGRNIPFRTLSATIRPTFNFAPTFCVFVPRYMAGILGRNYWTDSLDLADIDVHNGIEHDASLLREDAKTSPDQSRPCLRLVAQLLDSATGPPPASNLNGNGKAKEKSDDDNEKTLTVADLARVTSQRRAESRRENGQFSLSTFHKMFGSSNSATLLTIFGGRVSDLSTFLTEEKLPDGWESRIRNPMGLTMGEFQLTVLGIEGGVEGEVEGAVRGLVS
ncbi:Cloroperoxidase [Stereum hirsutum FP-91666 SS1]|uniref:Cloroperoxidase n=1 Tax=Stereum hirsutum (strain FP-91666) TaxID=721885 RepID=UPI000441037A|nr:Cloroperoxidase [Stereum hirsutum FP-91666 SS1]EIM87381.1 Cloroperoxidase [Stereum hirsutum FP-91666 SS1]